MDQLFSLWGPISPLFWVRAVWAIVILLVMVWAAGVGRRGAREALQRAQAHPNAILFVARVTHLGLLALGILFALAVLGIDLPALTAFVGLTTIAISLSVQDIARGLIAGLYLLIERPFDVGDEVKVDGQQGIIEDVRIRTTLLRNAAGDRVIVPNLVMLTSTIVQKNTAQKNAEA
ncbi:MAG: mechanosensitive ion channel [Chloroflexi bacterium]|nr:mechanosensitive ion channel [Chloroflexota bacterium]